MAIKRDFKDTVKNRDNCDPEFRRGLLEEALDAIDRGELDVAKILIRDYLDGKLQGTTN